MAGLKTLKTRIKSTKNIKQTTRAMEAVSAVKMRRAQGLTLMARPYALSALEILKGVRSAATHDLRELSPLLDEREVKKTCLAVVTSDKGLAGAFNTSVLRRAEKLIEQAERPVTVVAIGKKGRDYFTRKKTEMAGQFVGAGDFGTIEETDEISHLLTSLFLDGKADEIILVFTNFISALKQEVIVRKLLPFSQTALQETIEGILPLRGRYANMPKSLGVIKTDRSLVFSFEPSAEHILSQLLPQLLSIEVFHAILEANASEHSSRMMAMKNASENASELIDTLTVDFNKERQALITKELAEITGGTAALTQ